MDYTAMEKHLRTAGFTLVELLVVTTIIAILAGIIFPVLHRARRSAYIPDEIAHMRQLYVGVTLYESDNNDINPHWITEVSTYVSDPRIYASALDVNRVPLQGGLWPSTPLMFVREQEYSRYKVSYTYIRSMFTDDLTYQAFREKPAAGMLLSIWLGDPIGPLWPDPAPTALPCATSMGPPLQGPVLRINMDGSFRELPQHVGDPSTTILPLNMLLEGD
jgi:prepilin-type N-terminal cleavage/methylation domain-containing protein